MIIKNCLVCGIEYRAARKNAKYCSRVCQNKSRSTDIRNSRGIRRLPPGVKAILADVKRQKEIYGTTVSYGMATMKESGNGTK